MLKRLLLSALIVSIAIPTASAYYLPKNGYTVTSDGTKVNTTLTYTRRTRLDFNRAMDIYRELKRQGVGGLLAPSIHDRATMDAYLSLAFPDRPAAVTVDTLSTKEYVKPKQDVTSEQDANRQERITARRSARITAGKEQKGTTGLESDTAKNRRQ